MATVEHITRTDAETIAALEAKCLLLAASLKQAEGQAAKTVSRLEDATTDCASLFDCYASWHFALFQAIEHYTDAGKLNMEPLGIGERSTVAQLAGIGAYLADHAYSVAADFMREAT